MVSEECGYGLDYQVFDVPEGKIKIQNKMILFSEAEQTAIITNKEKVTSSYINTIHDLIQGAKYLRYWNQHGRFSAAENGTIDWDAVKHARASLPFDHQAWIVKHVPGFCGTSEKIKIWKYCDQRMSNNTSGSKNNSCPMNIPLYR